MAQEHLETVARILDPLTAMLRDDPLGASAADIALIATEYGLDRLPATVEAFLTIVGRDESLVQEMFAGEAAFDVATLLGDARNALRFAAELGAPELLLRGGLATAARSRAVPTPLAGDSRQRVAACGALGVAGAEPLAACTPPRG